MKYLLNATVQNNTLHLDEQLPLHSGTRVKVVIEPEEEKTGDVEPYSWMHTALEAGLEGPVDASVRVNDPSYRLGEEKTDE